MNSLVGLIHEETFSALLPHRARPGWECTSGPEPGTWWIKVPSGQDDLFSRLPLDGRWTGSDDGHLFRNGCRVPEYRIEPTSWRAVAEVMPIGTIKQTAPAMPPFPIGFGLVRCESEGTVNALLCRWENFVQWANTVLAQRIECLKFALSDDNRCLVWGAPLPGIDGTGFYQSGRLWIPSGFSLPEFLWPGLVAEGMNLSPRDSAIILADGSWELIGDDAWVEARRESIRSNRQITPPAEI